MNAKTTYLHHSPPALECTTSSRGRRAEQLDFSHKPYWTNSSVRTTVAEGTDMFHFVTSAGDVAIYYVWLQIKATLYISSYPNTWWESADCGLCSQDSIIDYHTQSCK